MSKCFAILRFKPLSKTQYPLSISPEGVLLLFILRRYSSHEFGSGTLVRDKDITSLFWLALVFALCFCALKSYLLSFLELNGHNGCGRSVWNPQIVRFF